MNANQKELAFIGVASRFEERASNLIDVHKKPLRVWNKISIVFLRSTKVSRAIMLTNPV